MKNCLLHLQFVICYVEILIQSWDTPVKERWRLSLCWTYTQTDIVPQSQKSSKSFFKHNEYVFNDHSLKAWYHITHLQVLSLCFSPNTTECTYRRKIIVKQGIKSHKSLNIFKALGVPPITICYNMDMAYLEKRSFYFYFMEMAPGQLHSTVTDSGELALSLSK